MARTYRRAEYGKRINDTKAVWSREDAAIGRSNDHLNPSMLRRINADWRVFTDAFGSDSQKPYKRAAVAEHNSSVRRFVRDALTRGHEPLVCNDRSDWTRRIGAAGVAIPIEEA